MLLGLFLKGILAMAAADLPEKIDPEKLYLFHLHGQIIEEMGPDGAVSPEFGKYDYRGIVAKLEGKGFYVISEARPKGADMSEYAEKVAGQVRKLIAAGVPPSHVTVTGFSKGGMIALLACAKIRNRQVNYVIAAGCPRHPFPALQQAAEHFQGRMLSMVDDRDQICGSCGEMFTRAKDGLTTKEIIYHEGAGHGLFYTPGKWLDDMADWAMNRGAAAQ